MGSAALQATGTKLDSALKLQQLRSLQSNISEFQFLIPQLK